ncbi:hypothetical protein HZA97_06045 [Candidatus Woesearchaeota archaeon]|nr:hypothetical protein [Candidatus Woesearchaeota archaeon]
MNKKVILLVILLVMPIVFAENFEWTLGNVDEIRGGSHNIGYGGDCSSIARAGRKLASIFGLAVTDAILMSSQEYSFSYSFPDAKIYSLNFFGVESNPNCGQGLNVGLSGKDGSASFRYSPRGEETAFLGSKNFNHVSFERSGGKECSTGNILKRSSQCTIEVTNLKVFAFDKNYISGRTSAFLNEEAKSLGKISDLIKNLQGIVFISSDNPKVMVWLGKKDSYDKKSTGDPSAEAFACLDSDENSQCDFMQAKNCNGDWYAGACCDGKSYDVGLHEVRPGMKIICGKNQKDEWQWAPLTSVGNIADFKNPNLLLVPAKTQSNVYEYLVCSGSYAGLNQNLFGGFLIDKQGLLSLNVLSTGEKHNYFCDSTQKVLAECRGNYPAFSETNSYGTGEKLVAGQRNIYCGKDGIWDFDLDYLGEGACVNAGFGWTGTKCCGEPEDFPENYNDPGNLPTSGGCWESNYVQKGNTIKNNQLLNYNGQFYGCQTSSATPVTVLQKNQCDVMEDATNDSPPKQFVCQTNKEWQKVQEKGVRTLTSSGWQVSQGMQEGCCLNNECWDGNQCQKKGFIHEENGKYYLCG